MLAHICILFRSDCYDFGQFFINSGKCSHGNYRLKLIVSDAFDGEEGEPNFIFSTEMCF